MSGTGEKPSFSELVISIGVAAGIGGAALLGAESVGYFVFDMSQGVRDSLSLVGWFAVATGTGIVGSGLLLEKGVQHESKSDN